MHDDDATVTEDRCLSILQAIAERAMNDRLSVLL